MIKRCAIATGFLVLISLPLGAEAQTTTSTTSTTANQQPKEGAFKKMRNKIKGMRPRFKRKAKTTNTTTTTNSNQ